MPEPGFKQLQAEAAAAVRAARVRHLPPRTDSPLPPAGTTAGSCQGPPYAELHCMTHFSFRRGASSPEALVRRAWALGYAALAITDECSVAGVVRAWQALGELVRSSDDAAADAQLLALHAARRAALGAQENSDATGGASCAGASAAIAPLKLLYGSQFIFQAPGEQGTLVALARNLQGWGDLCSFITQCRGAAVKGRYHLPPLAQALAVLAADCELLWAPAWDEGKDLDASKWIADCAGWMPADGQFDLKLLLTLHCGSDDALRQLALQQLADVTGWPLVAAGDVQMHVRACKRLHDVLCAIRLGRPVQQCGLALQPNAERHLRPRDRLAALYPPESLAATLTVAARCSFRLEEVRYHYPQENLLPGCTASQTLARLTRDGAAWRFPGGTPQRIQAFIDKELALIAECRYEMFFLTVHDIVRWARGQGILCQGRGSAANSVVCYCLGITEADPRISNPLLERFISRARRHEPPDIDVDFEHERREEVIQYIYRRYGRHRAALAAAVISWRTRSALRDAGAALGVDARLVDAFARDHHWFDPDLRADEVAARLHALAADRGVPLPLPLAQLWLEMALQLKGRPRHLSQHVGGFVLTETPLHRLVPVEPAAMEDRQIIQWDKDDLEALGMLKVDVLALGMLTAVRRCIELVSQRRGAPFTRAHITGEDLATYAMIRRADTVGTFQIESRAQMSMLPRLKPTTFYDLVVQVAIVRPGPITGGMVHPYLKARERRDRGLPIVYERSRYDRPGQPPRLAKALERTLGIPIFQEQVMELSMLAAGFSAEEADALRRAMAAWKRKGGLGPFEARLTEGMLANGYSAEFAARIFQQIQGFGEYGFPESHAYSFALIAYESAWLKCHEPEAFLAAMLNAQPMGFYGPSQLIQDARRHGVQVRPPDVGASDWDCTLEAAQAAAPCPGGAGPGAEPSLSAGHVPSAPTPAMPQRGRAYALGEHPCCIDSNRPAALVQKSHPAIKNKAEQPPRPAVRLGLRLIKGLGEATAVRIVRARAQAPFAGVADLAQRARLDTQALNALAAADALASLAGHRRQQAWSAISPHTAPQRVARAGFARPRTAPLLDDAPIHEAPLVLPAAPEGEDIVHDYAALGLSLRRHPLALLRERLARRGVRTSAELAALPSGRRAIACGLVTGRQQPGTAKGTIFVTLEDETGAVNVIVWPGLRLDEQQRNALLRSQLLAVEGEWQRDAGGGESAASPCAPAVPRPQMAPVACGPSEGGQVCHLIARRLFDLSALLGRLAPQVSSRDFH